MGLQVSALGLGCMGLSQWYGKALEEKEGIAVIHHAYNSGVTFFDTSDAYGPLTNEKLLGMVLNTSYCVLSDEWWLYFAHVIIEVVLDHLRAVGASNSPSIQCR